MTSEVGTQRLDGRTKKKWPIIVGLSALMLVAFVLLVASQISTEATISSVRCDDSD